MATDRTAPSVGLAGVVAALLVAGCVISPQPEPPTIDPERLTVELRSTNPDGSEIDSVVVRGEPGAVTPGGAVLHVVNLDGAETAAHLTVEEDGSFSVVLRGGPGDEIRLRALYEGLWSRPVDVVAPAESGPVLPPTRPLEGCLLVDAPAEVAFGAVAVGDVAVRVVAVRNECGEPARIDDVWLRIGATEPPSCDDEYTRCVLGADDPTHPEGEGPAECLEPWRECQGFCDSAYEECLSSGETEDTCLRQRDECIFPCDDERRRCAEEVCAEVLTRCYETAWEVPQGFSVVHGPLPTTVPSGGSRSVVVTFAPLRTGPAEDVLLIEVGSPEIERRPITLTGAGID